MEKRTHLDPNKCPGVAYFHKKEENEDERLKRVLGEVLGDVPKYMLIAGENRIWLWLISLLLISDTGVLIWVVSLIVKMVP